MYAIVSTGGKQYKVAKGDVIDVEKLNAQPGEQVMLDVLMVNDGKSINVNCRVSCRPEGRLQGSRAIPRREAARLQV